MVGVVVAAGQGLPPGLGRVEASADLHLVHDRDELGEIADRVQVLLVDDFRTTALEGVVDRAPRLEWIHTSSAGVDAVMTPELAAADVLVSNARGIFDRSIAEWVLGVILLFAKDLHTTLAFQERAEWQHRESRMAEGATVLVVGAGSIGREIATLVQAIGMRTVGVSRQARDDDPVFGRVAASSALIPMLREADYVVISAPLTDETRGMFGPEQFEAMPEHAYLINVGRGQIVQEHALLDAIRRGRIAGAALDVFETEPLPSRHPLWGMHDVVVSPHMSGDFEGWRQAVGELFADNFERWSRGEPLRNVVKGTGSHTPAHSG